jgi:hypothetical protein
MALTAAQRNALPPSAFAHRPSANRSSWKYPIPTPAMAKKAGISEKSRQQMIATAKAYSVRSNTASSRSKINRVAAKRK